MGLLFPHQLISAMEPLFKILSEPKELVIYDGGHVVPMDVTMTRTSAWLDQILGPVRK